MNFEWRDYDARMMGYVEDWLDESAVRATGLDEGFEAFYTYWAHEEGFAVKENFWCKVVFEDDCPFAVIALALYEEKITVMEVLVAPEKRGKGKGTKLLKELLASEEILGFAIRKSEAVIYPDNAASQKAFENAGFIYHHSHADEGGESMHYVCERPSA